MNQAANRKTIIAKIHVAKKQLGLDEDTYRATIKLVTQGKKSSCAECNGWELENILKHFAEKGFKADKRKASPKTRNKASKTPTDKIRALWIDMHRVGILVDGSEAALDAWVQRTTRQKNGGMGIERTAWLSKNPTLEAAVLEALKQWRKRVLLEWRNADYHLIHQECQARDVAQVVAVQDLLNQGRIFWWDAFKTLGIHEAPEYCTDRRLIQ